MSAYTVQHVVVDFKALVSNFGEPSEIFMSLWSEKSKTQLTEEFHISLTAQGMPIDGNFGRLKTIFKVLLPMGFVLLRCLSEFADLLLILSF